MTVKVLYKPVGKKAYVREVEDSAAAFRELVGGHFSGYYVGSFLPCRAFAGMMLLCHDEGKLIGLPPNCFIGHELLVGNVVFVGCGREGETVDVTPAQAELLANALQDASEVTYGIC